MEKTSFVLFVLFSLCTLTCKKEPPVVSPLPNVPDTTSHNFTFTQYTLGGTGGSSYFKDVAIINDTDIWAVGAIYTSPDTMYNAAHWDGRKWTLNRIMFPLCNMNGNPQGSGPYLAEGIFALSPNDIWFSCDVSLVHWDGQNFQSVCMPLGYGQRNLGKMWGTDGELYLVGTNGFIAKYSNGTWTEMGSGTDYDLTDVWGSPDGSVVWASGWRNYNVDTAQGILLRYDGTSWRTVWKRGANTTPPYGDYVSSLWCQKHVFTSTNYGVYIQSMSGVDTAVQSLSLNRFPYRIRGSSENNVVMVGDFGMIWHYNQKDWKMLNLTDPGQPLYSVAVSTNRIVAVGGDFDLGLGAALIYMGVRE